MDMEMSVFDTDYLKGIETVKIGNDCFTKVNRFVLDGLNELKSLIIGKKRFKLDENTRLESKCVIMNCDQLNEIHIGDWSFNCYESFELKNLPSLISIQLNIHAFYNCYSIVFESMNNWMMKSDSISIHYSWIICYIWWLSYPWIEWIWYWLIRSPFSDSNQRRWWNCNCIGKVILENDEWLLYLN